MQDCKTITDDLIVGLDRRLQNMTWQETDVDGEPVLVAYAGQIGFMIYTEREPAEWEAVILCMDDAVGNGHFAQHGTSLSISSAKIDCRMDVATLVDKAVRYLLGEVELETGPSLLDR